MGKNSSSKPIEASVPQGSCLSPQLFVIYINDFPLFPHSRVDFFADDTLLYASNKSNSTAVRNLQLQFNYLQPWFDQQRITINPKKTSAIYFSIKGISKAPLLSIQGSPINWASSNKYLGIQIDKKLNFSKHVKLQTNKAKAVGYQLYPLLISKSLLSINTKLYIFKSY